MSASKQGNPCYYQIKEWLLEETYNFLLGTGSPHLVTIIGTGNSH